MENGPFTDVFLMKTPIYKGFSMAMLNHQMVTIVIIHGVYKPTNINRGHHTLPAIYRGILRIQLGWENMIPLFLNPRLT